MIPLILAILGPWQYNDGEPPPSWTFRDGEPAFAARVLPDRFRDPLAGASAGSNFRSADAPPAPYTPGDSDRASVRSAVARPPAPAPIRPTPGGTARAVPSLAARPPAPYYYQVVPVPPAYYLAAPPVRRGFGFFRRFGATSCGPGGCR